MRKNGHDAVKAQAAIDAAMMRRCVQLSAEAAKAGEFPFAALICDGERVIVEAINHAAREADVTRHAELVAVSEAQRILGTKDLSRCTLYSNVEPCVMCSFPIRETRIARVVFAIASPFMGGFSRWNVLRDDALTERMPEAFGPVPEVIAGLGSQEAETVWRRWNPLIWTIIRRRGCFRPSPSPDTVARHPGGPVRGGLLRKLFMMHGGRGIR